MKTVVYILAWSVLATSIATPGLAKSNPDSQARQTLVRACLIEAKAPIYATAAYRNGSPRQREVLTNAYSAGVSSVSALCRQFETADSDARMRLNAQCQDLATVDAQGARLRNICSALAR